ncbi:MAG: hypothetical protein KDK34_01325 [Leptospiraceae bacterium]|nr:hypothetical protein [Leptospiraceae bacterium]
MAINNLKVDEFEVETTLNKSVLELKFRGSIHAANPEEFMQPFFDDIINEALSRKLSLKCDFVELEYMNSASIPPLIHLLRQLAENEINGDFIYDSSRKVQTASFRALDVIARKSDYTNVKGV